LRKKVGPRRREADVTKGETAKEWAVLVLVLALAQVTKQPLVPEARANPTQLHTIFSRSGWY
jgi:hypothetical protein